MKDYKKHKIKILCIIPARSGSQRVMNKNLLKFERKSLVELAYEAAKKSNVCDYIFVSTNKRLIARGLPMIKRSEKLSGPKSDISEAIHESLVKIEKIKGIKFDYVVCLQPTSPLRNGNLIKTLLNNVIKFRANGGITGIRVVPWLWKIKKKWGYNSWYPNKYPRSQSFKNEVNWQEINTVQSASRKAILSKKRWGLPLFVQFLPSYASIDIDDKEDFNKARTLFSRLKKLLDKEEFKEGRIIKRIN